MATLTQPSGAVSEETNQPPSHYYHAEAQVLSGHLKHPIDQDLGKHAQVALKNRRSDHITETVAQTSLEGLVSFRSGQSRVSGVKVEKKEVWETDHSGWLTLSTSVIEGLNVFEIITADRIVSQISTEHAFVNGHVPRVSFLGTQFHNLQVSGFPVTLKLDLGICGDKPQNDRPYLEDLDFLGNVEAQTEKISKKIAGERDLPKDLKTQYASRLTAVRELISDCKAGKKVGPGRKITCSLVQSIDDIPIRGVKSLGNVLVIPNFGWVALAEVEVGVEKPEDIPYLKSENGNSPERHLSNYFDLEMLEMNLGCVGGGQVFAVKTKNNGTTNP